MSQQFFQNPHEMQDHLPRKFRFAPFVLLIALISYAVIVIAMVTAPDTAQALQISPSAKVVIDTSNSDPWVLPSMPPKCSDQEISSGKVGGCVISKYVGAVENGWGTPPFPVALNGALNPGWKNNGWAYSGSPALKDWEAVMLKNSDKVGAIRAGALQAPPGALALFEGFLGEVQAKGFRISGVGVYNFRCTSNSRKDCVGLTPSSLSNHSWGLAADINVASNPEVRYFPNASSPLTACGVPMATNIPRWVVQIAEKWGLLWGGYGWSGGCTTPATVKSNVIRDPMHFEFRGTVEAAVKIAAVNGVFVEHYCSDVVETGVTVRKCIWEDRPQAGWRTSIPLQGPAGATSALVNITLTGASESGYVTAESCDGDITGKRKWSNVNIEVGATTSNLATVPLDALGRFCVYNSSSMHIIVDVQGFFLPSRLAGKTGNKYTPLTPTRVLDTRTSGGALTALKKYGVAVDQVPVGSIAVLSNITVTGTQDAGYLTADSCQNLKAKEQTRSNVNFGNDDTVANLGVIPLGLVGAKPGFCTVSNVKLNQIVDTQGVFAPSPIGQWGYSAITPTRLIDTRNCVKNCADVFKAGAVIKLHAPTGASAVQINLTLTGARAVGYATADKCSRIVVSSQAQSSVNIKVGHIAANLAVVPVDADGTFCIFTSSATRVIVDVQGTFSPSGDSRFIPASSVRRFDSRGMAN